MGLYVVGVGSGGEPLPASPTGDPLQRLGRRGCALHGWTLTNPNPQGGEKYVALPSLLGSAFSLLTDTRGRSPQVARHHPHPVL